MWVNGVLSSSSTRKVLITLKVSATDSKLLYNQTQFVVTIVVDDTDGIVQVHLRIYVC